MGNSNGKGLHEWYDPAKAERLASFQRGRIVRPLSRRHCLVVALIVTSAALAILFVFTKFMTR